MSSQQPPYRLLLLDGQPSRSEPLKQALVDAGWVVILCATEEEALSRQPSPNDIDLLVVSAEVSERSLAALEPLRRTRLNQLAPLLVLGPDPNGHRDGGERGMTVRVRALEAGADDVLLQPYSLVECVARCRALARRHRSSQPTTTVLRCGPIEMVVEEHQVRRQGAPVNLSPREFRLLQFLLEHQGRAWHREELLSRVWGEWEALDLDPKTVDVHVHWLRLKLEEQPSQPQLLVTVRGRGYRLG
jgi:two-component system phosphate regulon response regulator PhoB